MIRRGKVRCCLLLLSLVAACCLSACAGSLGDIREKPAVELRWPPPPFPARIQWVRNIATPEDAGITKGFWTRTVEFFTGADGSRIVRPYGVLMDRQSRLLISDPGAGVVHVMDPKRNRYFVIAGDEEKRLVTPIGLAEDPEGRLYIADSTSGELYRYDFRKEKLEPFHVPMLVRPTGIAYNRSNGLLYVVDTVANEVVASDLNGIEKKRFSARFNHPTDIYINANGEIYITDPLNYKIKVFTPEGQVISEIGTPGDAVGNLNKPKGVAVDREGHIYVCDALLDAVQVFDAGGHFLLSFGSTGTGPGEFWMPAGIYIDQQDYLFVVDTYNRRVQVFRYLPETKETGRATKPEKGAQ